MSLPEDVTQAFDALWNVTSTARPSASDSMFIVTATIAATFTSVIATANDSKSPDNDSRPGAENGECKLLGPFALFIQGALGILALLSLVYKRWRERPQRPVKIWAFDASKQVVGSALLHIANLFMSMFSSGESPLQPSTSGDYQANPCSFYLLNLAIDTTIGIPILIILLRLLHHVFLLTPFGSPPESIQSGNYGHPPNAAWWGKQCFIYFLGLLGMKICVFIFFSLCPWIITVGDWALRWTEGNEQVQVFFVMLFFPLVMNALQYYIIDGFIKNQQPDDHEQVPSDPGEDDQDREERRRLRRSGDEEREDGDSDEEVIKANDISDKQPATDRVTRIKVDPQKMDEYDPSTDGERSGSSGNGTLRTRR